MKWYQETSSDVINEVKSDVSGLKAVDREQRFIEDGPNELTKKKEDSEIKKFLLHFNDLLIYVLIGAGILKAVVGSYIDMTIIFAVVIINALIGYVQERKATSSLSGLNELLSEKTTILVNGEKRVVDSNTLVVGDIVLLTPGNIVPADLRIIDSYSLVVEEAILTGESTPVNKVSEAIMAEADLGDRINIAFSGTLVNSGNGKGIVIATGDDTELGKISQHLNNVTKAETPLIRKMNQLNKQIFYILLVLMAFLFVFSFFFRSYTGTELVAAMIALAVSAVPEGLPAVLSIILSVGVTRMAVKKAIIKKMPAVETLGSMSVICSDKTGTLTKNEMTVLSVITRDEVMHFADTSEVSDIYDVNVNDARMKLIETALYCNDTKIDYHNGKREVIGNPTEGALLEFANQVCLERNEHLLYKIPFDSTYKYMAVLVEVDGQKFIYMKGAPDVVLEMTASQLEAGKSTAIDTVYWEQEITRHAEMGQRMLAAAYKEMPADCESISHKDLANGLVLVGLYGIIDPPKKEAIIATAICHEAGINVKMITGDHRDTAVAIAKEIGLEHYNNAIIGSEIEALSDQELQQVVQDHDVFARTTPEHKLRLVQAIQANGQIVGMTGDGVNDAPALKKADIGIAMGIKGTQVTKDAADMILADDNFATIAEAVQEGRRVYDNLKKTIFFALPTAFAQGLLVVIALLADIALPLTSIQILWLNMVTTITLSFALGFEPLAANAMKRPPRDPNERILNGYAIFRIVYVSLLIAGFGFAINEFLLMSGAPTAVIQTTLLNTIVFGQAFYMINCRDIIKFSINKSILKNRVLWISLVILVVLQILIVMVPALNFVLGTAAIGFGNLALAALSGLLIFVIVEVEKLVTRTFFN
ncbi:HAD-IC family P-type ATPase [Culicoidibacter larvae]|uniref:HAD family hydrolase n=1 Tax=Culicoidibacter larvae TaxID=2579976 RepID=A0A5R8QA26_9FIRM|nr:HAD-IC family P-type ATPase [Culicoidibacter larvae]TLG72499.1 HAD family hydrolase [Culicoidibacter larvae]